MMCPKCILHLATDSKTSHSILAKPHQLKHNWL